MSFTVGLLEWQQLYNFSYVITRYLIRKVTTLEAAIVLRKPFLRSGRCEYIRVVAHPTPPLKATFLALQMFRIHFTDLLQCSVLALICSCAAFRSFLLAARSHLNCLLGIHFASSQTSPFLKNFPKFLKFSFNLLT